MAFVHRIDEEASAAIRAAVHNPKVTELIVYDADFPEEAGQQFVLAVARTETDDEGTEFNLTDPDHRDLKVLVEQDAARFGETVKFVLALTDVPDLITLTLAIENYYVDGDFVETSATVEVPDPQYEEGHPDYDDWAYTWIFQETGTGRTEGNSAYFVKVTEASDPEWVGREFEWGL